MIIQIEDLSDPALHDYTAMTDVALRSRMEPERGLFMAESFNVIERAINAGYQPRSFLMEQKWLEVMRPILERFGAHGGDIPVFVGSQKTIGQITGYRLHRGALAAMHRNPLPAPEGVLANASRIVVLEDIVDHTNVGAIFRSAAALDVDGLLVSPSCADPLYRRSVRVSMGTVFQVPWTRLEKWPDVQTLHDHGFHVAALALGENTVTLDAFSDMLDQNPHTKVAWVLGTEGHGLKPWTLKAVDSHVMIPMGHGVDSLNVAAAGAVAFWASRKRQ
ncbi:MAG: RNA methyltransferase [Actinomycetaceae bacterium]|nr:RNA methyltransferase [Actinomycetaceae bacterium]